MEVATKEQLDEFFGNADDAECQSCGFQTQHIHIYKDHYEGGRGLDTKKFACCTVCVTTFASNAMRYPSQYLDRGTMRMMAHCTNMILDAIKQGHK